MLAGNLTSYQSIDFVKDYLSRGLVSCILKTLCFARDNLYL
jgi:hypothetical protein